MSLALKPGSEGSTCRTLCPLSSTMYKLPSGAMATEAGPASWIPRRSRYRGDDAPSIYPTNHLMLKVRHVHGSISRECHTPGVHNGLRSRSTVAAERIATARGAVPGKCVQDAIRGYAPQPAASGAAELGRVQAPIRPHRNPEQGIERDARCKLPVTAGPGHWVAREAVVARHRIDDAVWANSADARLVGYVDAPVRRNGYGERSSEQSRSRRTTIAGGPDDDAIRAVPGVREKVPVLAPHTGARERRNRSVWMHDTYPVVSGVRDVDAPIGPQVHSRGVAELCCCGGAAVTARARG